MKICHLSTAHAYNDVRVFQKQCVTLMKSGYSVFYIVPHECDETLAGVNIVSIKSETSKIKRLLVQPFRVLSKALKVKARIHHFHDFELWPIAIILRLLGYKVIADIHEDVPGQLKQRTWVPRLVRTPIAWLVEGIENNFSRFMTAVITADSKLQLRFKHYNKCVISVKNYPLFFDLPKTNENKNFSVRSLGGMFDERCANLLIQSSLLLENTNIEVAGGISRNYQNSGWNSDTVSYRGRLSFKDARRFSADANILIIMFSDAPNHQEIKSNRLFESMYAGKPIIVSNLPQWKEFIAKYKCGIAVDPNEPSELAKVITWLKLNPDEAKKMGENGRQAVLQFFSWENEKKYLLNLYEQMK